jgi:hypothetical protein
VASAIVNLTDSELRALERLAVQRQTTVASLLREGVWRVIGSEPQPDDDEQRARALSIVGRFHSGLGDLSTEHDRYFAEDAGR